MNKLSVKEKHIYVTQSLQRQGAFKKDKQYPQAIDIALTRAQDLVIRARLLPDKENALKFEINQKYASDIQPLIKLHLELDTFKDTSIANKSYGMLPYDFAYLLSDRSYVTEDCKPTFTNPTEATNERVLAIPFAPGAAPYYRETIVTVNGVNKIFSCVGFVTQDEHVYVVDYILDLFKQHGVKAYWESYRDVYKSKTFLVVTRNPALSASITVDGTGNAATVTATSYTTFKSILTEGYLALNRDLRADFADSAQDSFYHKPIPTSPISVLTENRLSISCSERFLVSKIYLNYIRKPKRISLALNQGSELSPTVHQEICDYAVRILKKQIADPTYELENKEIEKSTI